MRILLDEMYTGLKPFLEALGWEVHTVGELGIKGADDLTVVQTAGKHGFTIVTQEHKVAELARLQNIPCVFVGPADLAHIISEKLKSISGQE